MPEVATDLAARTIAASTASTATTAAAASATASAPVMTRVVALIVVVASIVVVVVASVVAPWVVGVLAHGVVRGRREISWTSLHGSLSLMCDQVGVKLWKGYCSLVAQNSNCGE